MEMLARYFSASKFSVTPVQITSGVKKGLIGVAGFSFILFCKYEIKKREEIARIALKKERLSMVSYYIKLSHPMSSRVMSLSISLGIMTISMNGSTDQSR